MADFCHLHCHTQYSLLDGAAQIKQLVQRAQQLDMPAVGITDHGNLFGVPEFYTTARRAGIQPVIGSEFYITPSGMDDTDDATRYHQVLFAKGRTGYQNLIQLSSLSYTDGFYYKPRIDKEALRAHSDGLVATTCCLQGEVLQTILKQGEAAGREVFEHYLDIFGDDYYIELQDHGIEEQHQCNAVLLRWAKEYDVKVLATNDVHYVNQEDAEAQDVLLCLQTGKDYNDPNRMRFENDQFFLKSTDEMAAALDSVPVDIRQEAMATSREIADKCKFELPMGDLLMPHYPIPQDFDNDMDAYLRHLVYEGARRRYGDIREEVRERLDHELGIIKEMGYAGYFLIVQDFTDAARDLGVRVGPGRGSAAGSAVSYALGITNIDPLAYDLLFERFLNPDRVSMPDIDIDFDDRGRSKVIDYVVQKYGRENVCQIVTFGTMGPRSVIRDVARVLNIPLSEADRIAKLVPDGPGVDLDSAMNEVPELRQLKQHDDKQVRRLMHYAEVLEGSARHTGVHAAGVIIAPGEVSEYVPVAVAKSKGEKTITTQYDGDWVEQFGLLKMDFLGLKTLTVLNDTLDLVRENHGVDIDLDDIPLDDEATYELFQRGETVAVFQFESEGMREWLRKLQPTSINDLIAMNALYRPGPMDLIPDYIDRKHGREEVAYPHPLLEDILEPTYGIPVYQEQVMKMAQVMGGYSLGQADLLRRAMGKKKQKEMDKQRGVFVAGAAEKGVDEQKAHEVFDMMAKFAGYGFNKSHSAAYSVVAYQTGYLKAHYPAEFMAAAMTNDMGDTKKLTVVLDEAQRMGLEVLPASVNGSEARFNVENGCIRMGMGAIKGVGLGAIEELVDTRAKEGPFETIFDIVTTVNLRTVNKKALESLARVGAMDDLDGHRAQFVEALDDAVRYGQKVQADRAAGQNSLFGDASAPGTTMEPNLPVVKPWSTGRILKEERELTGMYVSGHPLDKYRPEIEAFASAPLGDAEALFDPNAIPEDDQQNGRYGRQKPSHTVFGIITEVQQRTTRSGKPIMFAQLEDYTGQAELVCFSSILDRVQQHLTVDNIVLVRGEVEQRGGGTKILVREVMPMWQVREKMVRNIILTIDRRRIGTEHMDRLHQLCDRNRGNTRLFFDVVDPQLPAGVQRVRARSCVVDASPELLDGMASLFGRHAVTLENDE
ncbi:MAG: DNA polymerase III subunit alpha [Bacteroidetes bacterium]|jgi:DNA polymerase-3 subunit alpha|nr:DNA polymerase III subunit alpha [Bacteroidota bacterium]